MPRARDRHPTEIPEYLWDVLDATARAKNITTLQLVAGWLTEAAWQHAGDVYADSTIADRLAALPRVDGRPTYPRRQSRESGASRG